jgi:hypothetical protein
MMDVCHLHSIAGCHDFYFYSFPSRASCPLLFSILFKMQFQKHYFTTLTTTTQTLLHISSTLQL